MDLLPAEEGFLGIAAEDAAAARDKPGAVVIPFGLEASVSYGGGTARGPGAIIDASHQVELFDEELWREPCRDFHIATAAPFAVAPGLPAAIDQIDGIVGDVLDGGRFPLTLGGEHSLTIGAVRAARRRHRGLAILQFDAHADLRDGYEGEALSHAAAMRRCLDDADISLVAVGIRNISAGEVPFLEENSHRIHVYWGKDRRHWDAEEIASHLAGRPVYVTVDVDGFDASLMPATGTPEPGGFFWDDATAILRAAGRAAGTIVGADITELAPIAGHHACDFLAAKLAYKILAYRFAG